MWVLSEQSKHCLRCHVGLGEHGCCGLLQDLVPGCIQLLQSHVGVVDAVEGGLDIDLGHHDSLFFGLESGGQGADTGNPLGDLSDGGVNLLEQGVDGSVDIVGIGGTRDACGTSDAERLVDFLDGEVSACCNEAIPGVVNLSCYRCARAAGAGNHDGQTASLGFPVAPVSLGIVNSTGTVGELECPVPSGDLKGVGTGLEVEGCGSALVTVRWSGIVQQGEIVPPGLVGDAVDFMHVLPDLLGDSQALFGAECVVCGLGQLVADVQQQVFNLGKTALGYREHVLGVSDVVKCHTKTTRSCLELDGNTESRRVIGRLGDTHTCGEPKLPESEVIVDQLQAVQGIHCPDVRADSSEIRQCHTATPPVLGIVFQAFLGLPLGISEEMPGN